MTPPKYPLCEALGVALIDASDMYELDGQAPLVHHVNAADLERILAAAPEIFLSDMQDGSGRLRVDSTHSNLHESSHRGRAVCVQPIVRDTAESLLRELVDCADETSTTIMRTDLSRIIQSARKLLGGKGE